MWCKTLILQKRGGSMRDATSFPLSCATHDVIIHTYLLSKFFNYRQKHDFGPRHWKLYEKKIDTNAVKCTSSYNTQSRTEG